MARPAKYQKVMDAAEEYVRALDEAIHTSAKVVVNGREMILVDNHPRFRAALEPLIRAVREQVGPICCDEEWHRKEADRLGWE